VDVTDGYFMISDPDLHIAELIQAGSDSFLAHWEGNRDLLRTAQNIKIRGKSVGVAINPATPWLGWRRSCLKLIRCGS